jgi:hypothetical protein
LKPTPSRLGGLELALVKLAASGMWRHVKRNNKKDAIFPAVGGVPRKSLGQNIRNFAKNHFKTFVWS